MSCPAGIGLVAAWLAGRVQRVPDRDRHAEVALPAEQPVAGQAGHPVLVAGPHVRRMPAQLPAPPDQRGAQFRVPAAVAQVPLPGGDDLERGVALLVELHRVGHRLGLAEQVTGRAGERREALPGLGQGGPGQLPVRGPASLAGDGGRRGGQQPAVRAEHRADRQVQVPPPGHVGSVAERADHRDAGALGRVGQRVGQHRHRHAEQRRGHGGPGQPGVPPVAGVRDQRHAGGQQFRPGGGHRQRGAVRAAEGQPVVVPSHLAVLQLGLGHRGAEPHVPQRRALGQVRLAAGQVAQELPLRHGPGGVADRPVLGGPVHGQPEPPPHLLERLLVQVGQPLAELDEVAPGDPHRVAAGLARRHERRVVGQRGITLHVEVVLHPALGGQPVVVPADRVEHGLAAHPVEPGHGVGVRERADVPDVQRPADGQRGSVNGEDALSRRAGIKLVLRPARPTGATTSPRCRQASAWPASRDWRAAALWTQDHGQRGGSRCSWRTG